MMLPTGQLLPPIDKLLSVEQSLAQKHGEFDLFGLFMHRDSGAEDYDLVVSAPWLESDRKQSMKLVANAVTKRLNPSEVVAIGRVLVLPSDSAFVEDVLCRYATEHGVMAYDGPLNLGGVPIQRMVLITAKRHAPEKGNGSAIIGRTS